MDTINDILDFNRAKNDHHTHVSMGLRKGRYSIDRWQMESFWNSYCDAVSNNVCFGIAEKPLGLLPILVDVDIKVEYNNEMKMLYSKNQVESIIRDYQTVLKEILCNCKSQNLTCFVLEKKSYVKGKYLKNGFHLHFPYTFLSKNDQEVHLLPRVKKLVNDSNIFENIGIEKSGDLIDACYLKNPWLLYGSSKDVGMEPYKLSYILDDERNELSLEQALQNYKIYDSDENEIDMTGKYEYYLPRILSINIWNRDPSEIRPNLPSMIKISNNKTTTIVEEDKETDDDIQNPERKDNMIEMLNIVKKQRFQDYQEWFKLLCLMKGNGLKKEDFLRYSQDSGYQAYNEDECLKHWYNLHEKRMLGFPTIHKWLEDDGIDWKKMFGYLKPDNIINELLKLYSSSGGSFTDKGIVEIFHKSYKTKLFYTNIGWIHYHPERNWETNDDDNMIVYPLMKSIGDTFIDYVGKMKIKKDQDEKDFNKYKKALMKEANKLHSYSFCSKIVKIARDLFRNDNILLEFDRKQHWFCFSNKKYIDLTTGVVGDIKEEDKIMTTCGYPLPERNNEDIKKISDIIMSIFGEKRYQSALSSLSYHLQAGNKQQLIFIHTGVASNGKSILGNYMRRVFGDYAGILPIEQLTQSSSGKDSANSSLAMMRSKRYCQFNEPEDDDASTRLKAGKMKELSGENLITVRGLYQKPSPMYVDFTMNILCNDIPKLAKSDDGVERRLRVITYPYKFVDEVILDFHKKKDEQVKVDSETSISLRNAFLWLLIDDFKKNSGRFIMNEDVKNDSSEYMKENNPIALFMDKYQESSTSIKQKQLYSEYTKWASYIGKEIISSKKFTQFLIQLKIKIKIDASNGNSIFVEERKEEFLKPSNGEVDDGILIK